jgi:glycosyltransferase 2 family protein
MSNFWKSTRRWLPGVVISLVAIAYVLYKVDLRQTIQAIRSANYWFLLISVAISIIWLGVRTLVWRTLLQNKATYRDVFLTVSEGYLLNNLLPFRLGEFGRAFLLGRKSDLKFMGVLPSIVVERALDFTFAAFLLIISVPFVVGAASKGTIAILIGSIMVLGLAAMYLLARNRAWALHTFDRLTGRWPRLQKQGDLLLAPLFNGLAILTDGWLFLRAVLWETVDWSISVGQFYLTLRAFFPHPEPVWVLFGLGMVALGNAVPSLPGAIGIFEAFLVGALTLVSGDQDTSLAVALVSHFFNYIVTGLIGAYALSTEGETLMGVYRQLRKSRLSLQPGPVGMDATNPDPPDNPTLPAEPLPDKPQPGMGLGKKE